MRSCSGPSKSTPSTNWSKYKGIGIAGGGGRGASGQALALTGGLPNVSNFKLLRPAWEGGRQGEASLPFLTVSKTTGNNESKLVNKSLQRTAGSV